MQSSGLSTSELIVAQKNFKKNEFSIPPADFIEFLIEHLTAPFFLFQLLCVLLWCLDEYWYYSIMTLVMLVIFEITVVNRVYIILNSCFNFRELKMSTMFVL